MELARRSERLDARLDSPRAARRLVRRALTDADRAHWVDVAQLAVSELVTNAVLHAHTAIEVTVEVRAAAATVSVRDFSPDIPMQRHWDRTATTGRGLGLVRSMTAASGVELLGSAGKRMWFRVDDSTAAEPDPADFLDTWDLADDLGTQSTTPSRQTGQTILLPALPVRLWSAAQQQWEAVLRELVLRDGAPATEVAVGAGKLAAAGAALQALSEAVAGAVAANPATESVLVSMVVQPGDEAAYGALQDVLDLGVQLGRTGELLSRPSLPEIIALRDWACEQVVAQHGGVIATGWSGADHPRFVYREALSAAASAILPVPPVLSLLPVPPWDDELVTESELAVVAADDGNRLIAVSRPAAHLLGWSVQELIGARVVSIVPPRLREAHVAGFTRHLTTGEAHVLGVDLELPVLRADGSEITCRFRIERAAGSPGRAIYLAWLTPLP